MEEVISLIFHGFKIVKNLEMNLPNLANQPSDLMNSCDEIIRVFGDARERLNVMEVAAYGGQMMHRELSGQMEIGGGVVQEWLRFSQAMDMGVLHASQEVHHGLPESGRVVRMGSDQATNTRETSGGDVAVQPMLPMDVGDKAEGSPVQRTRRRNETDRRTITVPAPRMGNTELPPEDGYTWRKYGQKEILGSRFPRAYYRCTHQRLYQCPAKKQVQRLAIDPLMFEVTYRGDHTCTMSTTAPLSIPPPPNEPPITTQSPPVRAAASVPLSHWLSMDIRTSRDQDMTAGITNSTNFDMQMYRDQFGLGGLSGRGGAGPSGTTISGGSGPSAVRYADYHQGVADLADAMFNSGSSSNNSMELIFSSVEDKWEGGDQKKN